MARKRGVKAILLNWRVVLLILFLVGSIAAIAANGLTYGIDIGGGVALIAKPEKPVSGDIVNGIVTSLQNRLNTFGVKDITIESQRDPETGESLIIVKIANVTLDEAAQIKDLIESQGVLYMEFNGVVFATGADITVYSSDYGLDPQSCPTCWYVGFDLSERAQNKFKEIASGKLGWPIDIFLDPPTNALFIVSPDVYQKMQTEFLGEPESGTPLPLPQRLEKSFNVTVVPYTNQSAGEIIQNATALGKKRIILADLPQSLYESIRDNVTERNLDLRVAYYSRAPGEDYKDFIKRILNLYGPYVLRFDPAQGGSTRLKLSGSAPTKEEALQEAKKIYSVLSSGSLAVKLHVISEEYISPTLGSDFRKQAIMAGIGALLAVVLIVYYHYRRWKIALPVASTSLFEVIIILGIAALIRWNLDLPSIAGIIAAIGTGVDQQVVITDELLGGSTTGTAKRMGVLKRMARAFFVILASATTTIVAMSFLLVYFVGTLKGFAVTTILGVLIGILVTRPAYAEIAKYLLSLE